MTKDVEESLNNNEKKLTFCLPSEYNYVISLVMGMRNKDLKINIFYNIPFSQARDFIIHEKFIILNYF